MLPSVINNPGRVVNTCSVATQTENPPPCDMSQDLTGVTNSSTTLKRRCSDSLNDLQLAKLTKKLDLSDAIKFYESEIAAEKCKLQNSNERLQFLYDRKSKLCFSANSHAPLVSLFLSDTIGLRETILELPTNDYMKLALISRHFKIDDITAKFPDNRHNIDGCFKCSAPPNDLVTLDLDFVLNEFSEMVSQDVYPPERDYERDFAHYYSMVYHLQEIALGINPPDTSGKRFIPSQLFNPEMTDRVITPKDILIRDFPLDELINCSFDNQNANKVWYKTIYDRNNEYASKFGLDKPKNKNQRT
ncbi:hypothetical protein AAF463_24150 (plasmid) [Pantoea sp. BJ2]|uniref:Uncharacterized protein n=1 Tax=Pantoea sp. BJ2 TaxID=3141322 RepID=A0AAU7U535_9GAMM